MPDRDHSATSSSCLNAAKWADPSGYSDISRIRNKSRSFIRSICADVIRLPGMPEIPTFQIGNRGPLARTGVSQESGWITSLTESLSSTQGRIEGEHTEI